MWFSLIRNASNRPSRWLAPPPQKYRVFQRGTQPRQRFARIQQLGFGAGEQVDIATDDAGDAGEGLHKVQRRAFAGEQNTRRAFQFEQRLVGFDRIAVGHVP